VLNLFFALLANGKVFSAGSGGFSAENIESSSARSKTHKVTRTAIPLAHLRRVSPTSLSAVQQLSGEPLSRLCLA